MSEIERDIIWLPGYRPSAKQIIAEVARRHQLTVDEMLMPRRFKRLAHARQEAMAELRWRTKLSLPQIAARLHLLDHTTVLHGIRAHERRIAHAQETAA